MIPDTANEDSVHLDLTRDQIRNSPPMDTDRPVSRQWLSSLHSYYGWGGPAFLPGIGLGSPVFTGSSYGVGLPLTEQASDEPVVEADVDEHLRSVKDVIGRHIEASDGEIGHVDDFAVDMDTLRIRSLIVDTSNMPGGRSVMVPVHLAEISWHAQQIRIRARRDEIARMPEPGPELRQ